MQWSKVKSILILILLIVDAFLLVNLFGSYYTEYWRETEKNENFSIVLSRKGIETDDNFRLPKTISLPMLEVDRNKSDEDAFTEGLLGEKMERTETPDGGTIYDSPLGRIEWSVEGKIFGSFAFENYTEPASDREMRVSTAKILEGCGISSSVQIETDSERMQAIAVFDTAGAPVFNRSLCFTFGEERISVNGWWTFQTPYMVRTNNYVLCESTDAILTLLNEETSISRIDAAENGYILLTGGGRQTSIVPCCRIVTDCGEFFVDSLKNTVIRM